jgi:hypothetical protein
MLIQRIGGYYRNAGHDKDDFRAGDSGRRARHSGAGRIRRPAAEFRGRAAKALTNRLHHYF